MSLFNPRVLSFAIKNPDPIPAAHQAIARDWAASIRNESIFKQNETQIEGDFKARIIEQLLGYASFGTERAQTVKAKQLMGTGEVDLALGNFSLDQPIIIAPFELKGAATRDLDAPMPGRKISPVQQAWNYANSVAGVRWVLVSNYTEIRLYGFGEGNQNYERFDLSKLDDPAEYAKLRLLLSADNLLGDGTLALLSESKAVEEEISEQLYADYKELRSDLIAAVNHVTGETSPVEAISTAQKVLDRVLFIAFAEDSLLLPRKSLEGAYDHRDLYHPHPIWDNFRSLFRAIDEGSSSLNIRRYNGGLFRYDSRIDDLALPDDVCEGFKKLGAYDFASEISVTILGHIFEQSIADIERLLSKARGDEVPDEKKAGTTGRRKRDGIVYTPEFVAQFIVERTLGAHVDELFAETMKRFAKDTDGSNNYEDFRFADRRNTTAWRTAEVAAWHEYRLRLKELRVVDPACGSGVFLVAAFDYLKAEYERVNKKLAELRRDETGIVDIEDVDSEILSSNLYGVDVNDESVEITKLSLWLKTARVGKELDSLDHTIRVGDSLIEDSNYAYLKHGFNWKDAFPEVTKAGGFDVVLGNPPYVRMERIKAIKPYLESRFEVVSDRADLYCYFYERGLRLLRAGGRLGFISSSTFFKTGAGTPLRQYLLAHATIETVTEFGDLQIFDGVTTYPAILTLRVGKSNPAHMLRFWKLTELPVGNFSTAFRESSSTFRQATLGDGSWELEDASVSAIRHKLTHGRRSLKVVYGAPLYGIKTGLNEAFYLDRATRDRLVQEHSSSEELLKPLAIGDDAERWRVEWNDSWIIYIPKGKIDIDRYPAVRAHLDQFRDKLMKRATQQEWFELQQAQGNYIKDFEGRKLVYPEMSQGRKFSIAAGPMYINNKAFYIPTDDMFLAGLLNSTAIWFYLFGICSPLRGGEWRLELRSQYVETVPIPEASAAEKDEMSMLAGRCHELATQRLQLQSLFRKRIPDLCGSEGDPKLNRRLERWWESRDFADFRKEIKKQYKSDIPLIERSDWERMFSDRKRHVEGLTREITELEAQIDTLTYRLFGLTDSEKETLEGSLAYR